MGRRSWSKWCSHLWWVVPLVVACLLGKTLARQGATPARDHTKVPVASVQEMVVDFEVASRNRLVITTPSHLVLLDPSSPAPTMRAEASIWEELGISIDPAGRRVATPGSQCVQVFDLETLQPLASHGLTRPVDRLDDLTFLPDGKLCAALGDGGEMTDLVDPPLLVTWDAGGRRTVERVRVQHGYVLALDPTGGMVAGCFNTELDILQVAGVPRWQPAGSIPRKPASPRSPCVNAHTQSFPVGFSPDGSRLAVDDAARLQLWDCTARKTVARTVLPAPAHSVAFSRDSSLIAAAGEWGGVLWDGRSSPRLLLSPTTSLQGPVERIRFTPDRKTVLMRKGDVIAAWDVESGRYLGLITLLDEGSHWLFVTPDGRCDGSSDRLEARDIRPGTSGHALCPLDRTTDHPGLLSRILAGERPPP